jgi:hypothetical protein
MNSTDSNTANTRQATVQRGRWQGLVFFWLYIGIGLLLARKLVAGLWPDLGDPWVVVVRIGLAMLIGFVVGLVCERLFAVVSRKLGDHGW